MVKATGPTAAKKPTGLLSCHPARGARLEIDLPGAQRVLAVLADAASAGTLLGETNERLPVKLLGCQPSIKPEFLSVGQWRGAVTLFANLVVGGVHLDQGKNEIDWLSFGFRALKAWLGHGLTNAARHVSPKGLSITLEPTPPMHRAWLRANPMASRFQPDVEACRA